MISLALISYITGFLFLLRIRSYDRYEKEPLGRLMWFTLIGGIVSVITASIIYLFIHPQPNLIDAILKIGTVEEFAKFFTLVVLFKIIKKEFDEIVDGLIYIAAIALGFSIIENIFYALETKHIYTLLAQRFLFATVGHITFSVYMGVAYFIHKKIKKNYAGIFIAFTTATLAHGLYDGFIFSPELNLFFIPVYILFIYLFFKLLKTILALSTHKKELDFHNFIKQESYNLHCCHCHNSDTDRNKFLQTELDVCKTCNHLIISKHNFNKILKYYRPILNRKRFFGLQKKSNNTIVHIANNQLFKYSVKKQRFNTEIHTLKHWFTQENEKDLDRYLNHSTVGYFFKHIGLKHFDFDAREAFKKHRNNHSKV